MNARHLPDRVVRKLNRLGFALVEGEPPYTFIRLGTSGELRILIQSSGPDAWRVGMAARAMNQPGRLPEPVVPVSLRGFGPSSDGMTLDVSTADLSEGVPRMIRDSLFTMADVAPT
jgi:hypothetical protein